MRRVEAAVTSVLGAVVLHALAVHPSQAHADTRCRAQSPPHTVALVELYTSEGCSSCPPADRWLSRLGRADSGRVAPLALHVSYWDYIGWVDPYAQPGFAVRQRWLTRRGGGRTVYTPGVFLDGREWTQWRRPGAQARAIGAVNLRRPGARIAIDQSLSGGGLTVVVTAQRTSDDRRRAALFVAVTEDGLQSHVAAGENRGALLRHDHVVRHWSGPHMAAGGSPHYRAELALPSSAAAGRRVTAFVQDLDNAQVLQALTVPVCAATP